MTFLRKMIEQAQGFLGKPKVEKFNDAVKHDRFDAALFNELLQEAPALREMVEDLNQKWNYTDDMVRDILMEFWQGDPRMRSSQEMRPGWLTNHAVAGHIEGSPDTSTTRPYTVHDEYGAAMATISVTQQVKDFLERYAEEQEEAQEAAEQAEEAEQDQQTAQECLAFAVDQAEEADGDEGEGEGEGSSDAQAAVAAMLQEALGMAEQAADNAEEAGEQAADAQRQACQGMRAAVQQGVKDAKEDLEEEAALMAGWGVEDGELKKMSFEERRRLAQRLRDNRLGDYAALLGRFRIRASAEQARRVEYGRDEVVGTELSGDLSRVVPVELVALGVEELELDFMIRFVEGRLLSRELRGVERVGKGAIIACIDCSGSMEAVDSGGISREAWAKAFALALLDQARRGRRDFVAVLFSSAYQQHVIEFPRGESPIDRVMELAEHFYGGGTDFMKPMDRAMDKLSREFNSDGKQKGDIVFVTDDQCSVTPDWMRSYQQRKQQLGFRTFGIQVGGGYGAALAAMSDNVRSVTEFADPDVVADIFRVIE